MGLGSSKKHGWDDNSNSCEKLLDEASSSLHQGSHNSVIIDGQTLPPQDFRFDQNLAHLAGEHPTAQSCCGCGKIESLGEVTVFRCLCWDVYIGPHWNYLLITYAFVLAVAMVVSAITWMELPLPWQITKWAFDVLSLIFLTCCALVNPGIFRKQCDVSDAENEIYCDVCKSYRPRGTVHCSFCKVCVQGYDHHCPWTGKCVGKKNIGYFNCFLLTVGLAFCLNTSSLFWHFLG